MRHTTTNTLYFTDNEVIEALNLWCQKKYEGAVRHFTQKTIKDFYLNENTGQYELCVIFSGDDEVAYIPGSNNKHLRIVGENVEPVKRSLE